MTTFNPAARRDRPTSTKHRRNWPSAWRVGLVLAWLALLAVPVAGLYNLEAFVPLASEASPPSWMPIYPPIP